MTEEKKKQEETEEVEEEKTETQSSTKDVKNDAVPYDRFQQVIEEKNEYKNELEKLKDKLEEMEDPNEIKTEYEGKLEEIEGKYIKRQKEFAVKEAALAEGVNKKALEDFAKVADMDSLTVEDGNVKGVEELINNMKEEKDYFFKTEEKQQSKSGGDFSEGQQINDGEQSNRLRKALGLQ